jgi:beta-lactamase superfamily II metal-dependent hydrolase
MVEPPRYGSTLYSPMMPLHRYLLGGFAPERPQRKLHLWGGAPTNVIGPPPGEFFSETNDNSVAILLTYGTARVLLAGDAEAREEEYMASGPHTGPLTGHQRSETTHTLSQGSAPC